MHGCYAGTLLHACYYNGAIEKQGKRIKMWHEYSINFQKNITFYNKNFFCFDAMKVAKITLCFHLCV